MSTLVTVRQTTTATTTTTTTMNTNDGNMNTDGQTSVPSYGITKPISMKSPDPADILATQSLEETLRSYDYFESDAELTHRYNVMAKLDTLVRQWIRDVSLAKNMPPENVDTVGGRVHTFGSYRLGVHSKGNIQILLFFIFISIETFFLLYNKINHLKSVYLFIKEYVSITNVIS
jgi:poly(A) polymerase Pap1